MDTQHYLTMLLEELAEIEQQLEDKTLSHSDQHLLNQAWDAIDAQIHAIETGEDDPFAEDTPWRDAAEYLESEEEDDARAEPLRVAPAPPSVTLQAGITRSGELVARAAGGEWRLVVDIAPLREAPPLPEEDDPVDDRGCAHCAGCAYCEDSQRYDGADEV